MTELLEALSDRNTKRALGFASGFSAIGFLFALAWLS